MKTRYLTQTKATTPDSPPRALPWADLFRPFRAETLCLAYHTQGVALG